MATINNFLGFETGGLEEVQTIVGAPTVQSSVVRNGTFALQCDANENVQLNPFEDVADAGDDQIVGFAVQFTDVTPAGATIIFQALESVNNVVDLRLATSGDLELLDSAGAVVGTATLPFIDNRWHYVEVRWQHLDSGAADVFVDDVSVISVTGQDFNRGATFDGYQFENQAGSGITIYFDDIYVISGASGTADFLGKNVKVVGAYQKTDGAATELGSTLDTGTWALASQTPAVETSGNTAIYTGTPLAGGMQTDSGTRSGPNGDPTVGGNADIRAAKGVYRMKRGGGSATTHESRLGNSGDGMTNKTMNVSNQFKTFVFVSEAATIVPTDTETFQLGMAVTGNRNLELGEAWGILLVVLDPSQIMSAARVGELANVSPLRTVSIMPSGQGPSGRE